MTTSVDIRSEDFLDRPVACLGALRASAPACPVEPESWLLITRHDLVRRILQDTAGFPTIRSKHQQPPAEVADQVAEIRAQGWPYTSALGTSNPPDHTAYRRMVNKSFTPRTLQDLEPLVRQAADDLARILPNGVEIDFQADFAEPLPVWAISRVLGLPPERSADIRRWSTAAISTIGSSPAAADWIRYEEDLLDFQRTMVGVLEASRDSDEPGLIAQLARDLADGDDSDASELPRLITLLRELVVAGNETTGKFIAEAVRTFGADPTVWERIRQDPDFAENVVEEAVRMASPTQHVIRVAADDIDLDGTVIEKGRVVMLSLASANRDEAVFPDPDVFDPDREGLRAQMAFGQGVHSCVGAGLARMESIIAMQVLAEQVERIVATEPAGPYTRSYIIRGPLEMRATVHRRGSR